MKKYLFLIAIIALVAISCHSPQSEAPQDMAISNPIPAIKNEAAMALPPFRIVDANGQHFNLADFKGKKVFVNLWASWCPPCRAEIPSIEKLYSKVDKSKAAFVMLSLDNDFEAAIKFAEKLKMKTPVFYPAENLPAIFNVQGIPVTFIFDEKGNLITQIDGGANYDTEKYLSLFNK